MIYARFLRLRTRLGGMLRLIRVGGDLQLDGRATSTNLGAWDCWGRDVAPRREGGVGVMGSKVLRVDARGGGGRHGRGGAR